MDVYQRRRLVALSAIAGVFVLIVVVIATAGGDDEPQAPITTVGGTTGQQTTTQPKKEYIDSADAICGEVAASLAASDATDEATAAADELDAVSTELSQLQSLDPPDEDADAANRFLRALEAQARALDDRQLAVERQDDSALADIDANVATAQSDAQAAAEEFGFKVCGNPDATGGDTGTGGVTTTAPTAPAPVTPAPVTPAPTDGGAGTGGGTGGTGGGTGGVSP